MFGEYLKSSFNFTSNTFHREDIMSLVCLHISCVLFTNSTGFLRIDTVAVLLSRILFHYSAPTVVTLSVVAEEIH